MNVEGDHSEAEDVRKALEKFLDRVASAVADGLARTKVVGDPGRDRSTRPPEGGAKSYG